MAIETAIEAHPALDLGRRAGSFRKTSLRRSSAKRESCSFDTSKYGSAPTWKRARFQEVRSRSTRYAGDARRASWSRRVAADLAGIADALTIMLAAAVAGLTADAMATTPQFHWIEAVQLAGLGGLLLHLSLLRWTPYDPLSFHDHPVRPWRLFAAVSLACLGAAALAIPFGQQKVEIWERIGLWLVLSFVMLLASRAIARRVLARLTAMGRFDARVAVFGAGEIARRVHDHLADPAVGIRFVGVYEDREAARADTSGLTTAGRLDDLVEAAREGGIDQVILALPPVAAQRIAGIVQRLEPLPVSVHIVTHLASDLVEPAPRHTVSTLGPVGLMDAKHKALADWAPLLKRIEDYVLGSLALLASLPLLALIALAIKLDSPGPVLFVQRRRGLNHSVIRVLKFRTMTVLEDGRDLRQATPGDSRITRVGRILRRTSLDELPQIINVLRGEMSLVGPRPHALSHDTHWGAMIERYANRSQVRPGITGLAQINGWRGEVTSRDAIKARVEHDLAYIAGWSIGLDLRILARTVTAVVRGSNAH